LTGDSIPEPLPSPFLPTGSRRTDGSPILDFLFFVQYIIDTGAAVPFITNARQLDPRAAHCAAIARSVLT
jgi:hypothetical protein